MDEKLTEMVVPHLGEDMVKLVSVFNKVRLSTDYQYWAQIRDYRYKMWDIKLKSPFTGNESSMEKESHTLTDNELESDEGEMEAA